MQLLQEEEPAQTVAATAVSMSSKKCLQQMQQPNGRHATVRWALHMHVAARNSEDEQPFKSTLLAVCGRCYVHQ